VPDPYAVLGVPRHATQAELSHAYRALLRRHHPDTRLPADDSQRAAADATLQHVLAAYTVLRDAARRADYDRETKPAEQRARGPAQPLNHHDADAQAPIIAGPVRWRRTT
jgi:DnaJ-class molecular chaperone